MGLLEFFCHFIDDPEYRRRFVNTPLTGDRLKELRRYRLSPQQIGMVLREDKAALAGELFTEIASLDLRAAGAASGGAVAGPAAARSHRGALARQPGTSDLGGDPLRAIVRWPGPLSVAVETLTPAQGQAKKAHEVMVKGWNFAQQVQFEFELEGIIKMVKPKWVHVALSGESWAAIELSVPRKGKWTITARNLTGDHRPTPVSTSLPAAFDAC
jgi:hypothetical protein